MYTEVEFGDLLIIIYPYSRDFTYFGMYNLISSFSVMLLWERADSLVRAVERCIPLTFDVDDQVPISQAPKKREIYIYI